MDASLTTPDSSHDQPLCVVLVSSGEARKGAGPALSAAEPHAEVLRVPDLGVCTQLVHGQADVILLDESAGPVAEESIAALADTLPGLPIVILVQSYDAEQAKNAIRAGAADVVSLDAPDAAVLRSAIRHAVWRARGRATAVVPGVDPLTGLADRAVFESHLERAILQSDRAGRQLAVLLLDVDGLAAINDGVGHDVGDLVLSSAASRLVSGTRRSDVVARLSGSNFAILLHDVVGEHAPARVADYVLRLMQEPVTVADEEFWVGSNVGIAMFPRDGAEPARILGHAEVALHQARLRGRGEYRFHSESMNTRAHKRLVLENKLRRALQNGGLRVAYQPQVDTVTRALVGAEALVRWSDPDLGEVSPVDLIPVAEQTGLIIPLGAWVLQTATRQLADWKRDGLSGVRMSVNVSAHQLERLEFREVVTGALWDANLDPSDLVLEVTESALIENESAAIETLGEFARRGIGVSLDDFGTGFSSLAFLKRFPLETVKIDRSFIQELVLDPDDRAIVIAILSIARQLKLSVTAEGVETEVQRAFLEAHGCDEIQGYLISPAVPPDTFMERFGPGSSRGSRSGSP